MATCAHCKKEETELHENGVPICLDCSEAWSPKRDLAASSEQDIRAILSQEFVGALARNADALSQFEEAIDRYNPGLPTRDGALRIKSASKALSVARKEKETAHNRLNDYLSRGIVPNDLKQNGSR